MSTLLHQLSQREVVGVIIFYVLRNPENNRAVEQSSQ